MQLCNYLLRIPCMRYYAGMRLTMLTFRPGGGEVGTQELHSMRVRGWVMRVDARC